MGRLATVSLTIFVFWFGLKTTSIDSVNLEERNFNTPLVRTVSLVIILLLQAVLLWNFIMYQSKKKRERLTTKSTTVLNKHNLRSQSKKSNFFREYSYFTKKLYF